MRRTSTSSLGIKFLAVLVALLGWFISTPAAQAQCSNSPGYNAVYGSCTSSTSPIQGTAEYIDASAVTPGSDICATLYSIISGLPTAGAVVDARGITSGLTCASGNTPWVKSSSVFTTNPATILLPAGTITIANTWIMPQYAKLIGQGPGLTTITPAASFASGVDGKNALIEMGSQSATLVFCGSNNDCVGVGVQDLTLNLNSAAVQSGIYNETSQETSYVDNVVFNNVGNSTTITTALEISVVSGTPSSSNSGPYSNLVCNIASGARAETRCVDLLAHTRGVHGITCNGGSATPTTAITLDSDANTIKDVYIDGFFNGIYVGSQAGTLASLPQSPTNVLYNISGGLNVTNLIRISNNTTSSTAPVCPGSSSHQAVCDLTVMNATAAANTTIQDDINTLPLTVTGGDANVGIYILGEQLASTTTTPPQYSRFTTSPRLPTWGTGTSAPASTCTATGSLYSDVSTGSSGGLYACVSSTWTKIP